MKKKQRTLKKEMEKRPYVAVRGGGHIQRQGGIGKFAGNERTDTYIGGVKSRTVELEGIQKIERTEQGRIGRRIEEDFDDMIKNAEIAVREEQRVDQLEEELIGDVVSHANRASKIGENRSLSEREKAALKSIQDSGVRSGRMRVEEGRIEKEGNFQGTGSDTRFSGVGKFGGIS